jgi:hypothetical protein
MPRFRCRRHGSAPRFHEFADDTGEGVCQRCIEDGWPLCCAADAPEQIHELVDIHLIVMDPRGPILGSQGRQHVACEPKRDGLALHRHDQYAATDDARIVTCPSCQGTAVWKQIAEFLAKQDKAWARDYRRIQQEG